MQRRVARIFFQESEILVGKLLDFRGKLAIKPPELGIGTVPHRSVQRPSSRSRKASSPNVSSRPAITSFSNCRSQASASNFANQLRNVARSRGESAATADS